MIKINNKKLAKFLGLKAIRLLILLIVISGHTSVILSTAKNLFHLYLVQGRRHNNERCANGILLKMYAKMSVFHDIRPYNCDIFTTFVP